MKKVLIYFVILLPAIMLAVILKHYKIDLDLSIGYGAGYLTACLFCDIDYSKYRR